MPQLSHVCFDILFYVVYMFALFAAFLPRDALSAMCGIAIVSRPSAPL